MNSKTAIAVAAAVAATGAVAYAAFKMSEKKEKVAEAKSLARAAGPRAEVMPRGAIDEVRERYGCGNYGRACTAGEVGGCKQYEDYCRSPNAVRSEDFNRPGECPQFSAQCQQGDYVSCDMYARSCQRSW